MAPLEGVLHLRLGDWARHRHAARRCAALESQEGLAPRRYHMLVYDTPPNLGVCHMRYDICGSRVRGFTVAAQFFPHENGIVGKFQG